MGVLLITPEKCTNCEACELACSFAHEEEFNPSRSRVHVLAWEQDTHSSPVVCLQCEDAACMVACPAKAITQDPATGARVISFTSCIQCRMCMQVCPFGCTTYDTIGKKLLKCDLCGGDPQCAKVCPSGAITDVDRTAANTTRRVQAAERLRVMLRQGGMQ
ncbi:MAG: 4Fe-4S dicluster domain-containing protein [Acidobacteriota bacterium]|nr:4Fe-4S dicluster domain-containing protein [Acidobacteriota bacterium]